LFAGCCSTKIDADRSGAGRHYGDKEKSAR
jgi:hypothetical protein